MPNKDQYESAAFHAWLEDLRKALGLSHDWFERNADVNSGTLYRAIFKNGGLTYEQRERVIKALQKILRQATPPQYLDLMTIERMSGVALTMFVPVHDLIAIAHELRLEFPRDVSRIAIAEGLMPGDPCHNPLAQAIAEPTLHWQVLQFEEDAWLAQARTAAAAGDWAYWADCTLHAALMAQYRLDFFRADKLLVEVLNQVDQRRLSIGPKADTEANVRRAWNLYRLGSLGLAKEYLQRAAGVLQQWHPSKREQYVIFFRQRLHACNGLETKDLLSYILHTNLSHVLIEEAFVDLKRSGTVTRASSLGLESKKALEDAQGIRLRIQHRAPFDDDWQAELRLALIAITQNATKREVSKLFTRARSAADAYATGEPRIALYHGIYLTHPDIADGKSISRGLTLIEEAKAGYHPTSPTFYAPGYAAVLVAEAVNILEAWDLSPEQIPTALRKLYVAANVHPNIPNIDLLTRSLLDHAHALDGFESARRWITDLASDLTSDEWAPIARVNADRSPEHTKRANGRLIREILALDPMV